MRHDRHTRLADTRSLRDSASPCRTLSQTSVGIDIVEVQRADGVPDRQGVGMALAVPNSKARNLVPSAFFSEQFTGTQKFGLVTMARPRSRPQDQWLARPILGRATVFAQLNRTRCSRRGSSQGAPFLMAWLPMGRTSSRAEVQSGRGKTDTPSFPTVLPNVLFFKLSCKQAAIFILVAPAIFWLIVSPHFDCAIVATPRRSS